MTVQQDLDARSPEIAWPAEFEPTSGDLFAHNEIRINAGPERVWRWLVAAPRWPEYYPNSKDVSIDGGGHGLADGTVFHWSTFGLPLESRVVEFEPNVRLGWHGYAPGEPPAFFHRFLLKPDGDGCLVITEETGNGPGAKKMRDADEERMHRSHDLWLATLKWRVEEQEDM